MIGSPPFGPGPLGWDSAGWLARTTDMTVATAIARDAGITRRALLSVSPAIRNPKSLFRRKLRTRAAGVNGRHIRFAAPPMTKSLPIAAPARRDNRLECQEKLMLNTARRLLVPSARSDVP